ncbi:hypothetical protein AVEN_106422-1 [Araneus ventricosus]|uniref:Uncharacterized protein n=1 Tax=Araneus ventricosus TaxID=182803 RepID=A0A4Y2ASF6_ARAVE|nr:hypothetical protein AVEN_106422-1 [Araneus ventricosus]
MQKLGRAGRKNFFPTSPNFIPAKTEGKSYPRRHNYAFLLFCMFTESIPSADISIPEGGRELLSALVMATMHKSIHPTSYSALVGGGRLRMPLPEGEGSNISGVFFFLQPLQVALIFFLEGKTFQVEYESGHRWGSFDFPGLEKSYVE